jgi:hypothetical protein
LVKGQRGPQQIKKMNTQNNNNTAAPSVTIAPRNPDPGILNFVVTLTTAKEARSYPCRSRESALKLAERFIAGVTKPAPQPEPAPAPAAEPVAARDQHPRLRPGIFPLANQAHPSPMLDPFHEPKGSSLQPSQTFL